MTEIAANADNSDLSRYVETCGLCDVKFTALVHYPPNESIMRGQPYRHESNPSMTLCWNCYRGLRKAEDT